MNAEKRTEPGPRRIAAQEGGAGLPPPADCASARDWENRSAWAPGAAGMGGETGHGKRALRAGRTLAGFAAGGDPRRRRGVLQGQPVRIDQPAGRQSKMRAGATLYDMSGLGAFKALDAPIRRSLLPAQG